MTTRTSKKTPKKAAPVARPRTRRAPDSPKPGKPARARGKAKEGPEEASLASDEAALRQKYPHVIEGSLKAAGMGPFGHKRTATIKCPCGSEREVATSDLFHVDKCESCTKEAKKEARRKNTKKQ